MPATLVILNAKIRPLFAAKGTTALALRDGRIAAMGGDADMRGEIGPDTQVIDAEGRELLPGFIESHLHLFMGGASLSMLNLGETFGFEATREAFLAFIAQNPADDLISGFATNYTIFGEDRRPNRHDLDRICADRPICLNSVDLHCAWANT
ncbi:amidohydrolase family protein, partial [Pseudophaeobacter sp.]